MTSPTLVPPNQAGSKRFTCQRSSGSLDLLVGRPFMSSEKTGSLPSCLLTWRARDRYSRFTHAAGSTVGAMCTVEPSSTRQHMPWEICWPTSLRASGRLQGIISGFQPMLYLVRSFCLRAASLLWRASWSSLASRSMICALHSPCSRAVLRLLANPKLPMGSRHWGQSCISSPSESCIMSGFAFGRYPFKARDGFFLALAAIFDDKAYTFPGADAAPTG
mmetsp:Transcript_27445/g.63961  ORF Transcript_27445/g.63961 Transcript_27445/m.63961 type:complete len:219 (-) Transcript_27445:111-767(-)